MGNLERWLGRWTAPGRSCGRGPPPRHGSRYRKKEMLVVVSFQFTPRRGTEGSLMSVDPGAGTTRLLGDDSQSESLRWQTNGSTRQRTHNFCREGGQSDTCSRHRRACFWLARLIRRDSARQPLKSLGWSMKLQMKCSSPSRLLRLLPGQTAVCRHYCHFRPNLSAPTRSKCQTCPSRYPLHCLFPSNLKQTFVTLFPGPSSAMPQFR